MDQRQRQDLDAHITRSDDAHAENTTAMAVDVVTRRWAHQVWELRQIGQFLIAPELDEVNEVRAEYELPPLTYDDV